MPIPSAKKCKVAADSNVRQEEEKDDSDLEVIELDPDIEVIDPDGEEPEQKTLYTDEFFETHRIMKEEANNFFDPSAPTNVANIPEKMRMDMVEYAAAMFAWICCLPTAEILVEINIGDIDLPFPVPTDRKRKLIKREYGKRLIKAWKETQDTEMMAKKFKLKKNVALLTLLDHGFTNSKYEMDMFPLLKAHGIAREDYHRVAEFVFINVSEWEEPIELIEDSMLPPIHVAVALYLMKSELTTGKLATIPWEELDRDLSAVPRELLEQWEKPVLEGFRQLDLNDDSKKINEELAQTLMEARKVLFDVSREENSMKNQLVTRRNEIADMARMYVSLLAKRRADIGQIRLDIDLSDVDEDILCVGQTGPDENMDHLSSFAGLHLTKQDLVVNSGMEVLARKKEDASEKFQKASVLKQEEDGRWEVRFSDDSISIIPLSSMADVQPMKGKAPMSSEGVRVIARVRHPCRSNGLYSGTLLGKCDRTTLQYMVAFDDLFEEYVGINELHLMMAQPFNEHGEWDRSLAYHLMTPNDETPGPSDERRLFLMMYFSAYPEWNMVKMSEQGKNVSVLHRNGEGWVAQVLKQDRHMVWLRFNPKETGFDSMQGCLDFPCRAQHDHIDEKMYRGNPRLKLVRTLCDFDKSLEIYRRNDTVIGMDMHLEIMKEIQQNRSARTRQEQRALRRLHADTAIERAIPKEPNECKPEEKKKQTARKCGTPLQIEPEVPKENKMKKKKAEFEGRIQYHKTENMDYVVKKGETGKYHAVCTQECLKGLDGNPLAPRFLSSDTSPFYVPILCGWRRMREHLMVAGAKNPFLIHYRAPCGRPLHRMNDIADYLEVTQSLLTVDYFTFSSEVDETRYVLTEKWAVVKDDVTNGLETRKIPIVNDNDDNEPLPAFVYRAKRYPLNEKMDMKTDFCSGCDCTDDCRDWTKCACQRLTHRESVRAQASQPVITKGYSHRLLEERVRTGIFECNKNCGCNKGRCMNRLVQNDLKVPMHMIRTPDMGWGVRTLVDIPKGTFIACYNGAVMSDTLAETNKGGDEYYADIDFYEIMENEKVNAGVNHMLDQGAFFDDVGTRELTEEEKQKVEEEDRVVKWMREADEREKRRKLKEKRAMQKELERKKKEELGEVEGEDEREKRRRWREQQAMKKAEEGKGDGEEEEEKEQEEGQREEEEREEEEEDLDEGVEIDDGESMDEEMKEEDNEEKKKEEKRKEEEERRKQDERKEVEEKNKEDMERRKRLHQESKNRYSIPINNPDKKQLDAYFEDAECENLYLIDAKNGGNIGRQFNHSCDPNLFTQHSFVDTHDIRLPWVAFFSSRDIKAGEELCWDYGWTYDEQTARGLKCQCGADNCRIDLL